MGGGWKLDGRRFKEGGGGIKGGLKEYGRRFKKGGRRMEEEWKKD